jgi:hypothetical protein
MRRNQKQHALVLANKQKLLPSSEKTGEKQERMT